MNHFSRAVQCFQIYEGLAAVVISSTDQEATLFLPFCGRSFILSGPWVLQNRKMMNFYIKKLTDPGG